MKAILNLQYDIVHDKIICDSPPLLKQLTTVKTATNLWYPENEFNQWYCSANQKKIQDKVPSLTIPKTLKESVALMAELVEDQLSQLNYLVHNVISFSSYWFILKKSIHWTTEGTIDKRRTLEAFADCEELDLET